MTSPFARLIGLILGLILGSIVLAAIFSGIMVTVFPWAYNALFTSSAMLVATPDHFLGWWFIWFAFLVIVAFVSFRGFVSRAFNEWMEAPA